MALVLLLWLVEVARADILLLRDDCPPGTRSPAWHGSPSCAIERPCEESSDCAAGLTCRRRAYCLDTRTRRVAERRHMGSDGTLYTVEAHDSTVDLVWTACPSHGDCEKGRCEVRGSCERGVAAPPPEPHAETAAVLEDSDAAQDSEPPSAEQAARNEPDVSPAVDQPEPVSISPVAVGALVSGAVLLALAAVGGLRKPQA